MFLFGFVSFLFFSIPVFFVFKSLKVLKVFEDFESFERFGILFVGLVSFLFEEKWGVVFFPLRFWASGVGLFWELLALEVLLLDLDCRVFVQENVV